MTTTGPLPLEPANLLHHDRWLRALARSLVHGADVDDLVQDTWTAALRQRPDASQSLRGWLATVLRRLAARRHRAAARRAQRERDAGPEPPPSIEATVALLELQRRVSAAVSAMPEPYRASVLLRYFHGLSHAEIAAREGQSEAAVRKRLERGLELLRTQLQRVDADWKRAPAMLVLAGPCPLPFVLLPGVLLMTQTFKITAAAVALVVLGGIGWWLQSSTAGVAAVSPASPSDALPVAASAAAPRSVPAPAESERVAATPVPAKAAAPPKLWRGRVLDQRGRTLAGVPLVVTTKLPTGGTDAETESVRDRLPAAVRALSPQEERPRRSGGVDLAALPSCGRSAADGSFAVEAEYGYVLAGPGWATLRSPALGWDRPNGLLLVAVPAVAASGEVVDERGAPLTDVRVAAAALLLGDFPAALDASNKVPPPFAYSAADGTFAIEGLPAGEDRIGFHLDGYVTEYLDVPPASSTGHRIVLRRVADHLTVAGVVLDHRELPVAGALVGLHRLVVQTDGAGRFSLVFRRREEAPDARSDLFAAAPGYQTLVVPRFGARLHDPAARDTVLHLAGPALAIAGTVVDADGHAIPDALVYPWDEPAVLNNRSADELGMPPDAAVESLGPGIRVFARTDRDGAFRLGGLRARDYRLHVLLKRPRAGFTSEPLPAGSEAVRLSVPPRLVHERLAGTVVARDGTAVAGVYIGASLTIYRMGGSAYGDRIQGTTSGADGRFELRDMPCADLTLHYSGAEIVPGAMQIDEQLPLLEQRLIVVRRRHLRVDVDPARGASRFRVVDAAGKELPILELTPGGSMARDRWPLENGRSGVLAVAEDAALVVLEGDAGELVRLPLHFAAGEVTVVRY